MISNYLQSMYRSAVAQNRRNIQELCGDKPYRNLCDLGCDDGEWTIRLAQAARATETFGVEIVADRARLAFSKSVRTVMADLNHGLPFEDESFDLVHANQVIEHVPDIDHFLAEARRVLRTGGDIIISTENGSSWHNIFAAVMGWQIFSLTNVSTTRLGVGNPMALHRGEGLGLKSWTHKTIFNYRGLSEILTVHGLSPSCLRGAGYYPLPAGLGNVDVRHSHFITAKATKTRP